MTTTETMNNADTVGDYGHVIPDPPDGIFLIRTSNANSATGWGWLGVCRDCANPPIDEGDWVSILSYAKMNNFSDTSAHTLEKLDRAAERIAREAGIDPTPAFD